jgi:hypothetical protein
MNVHTNIHLLGVGEQRLLTRLEREVCSCKGKTGEGGDKSQTNINAG